MVIWTRLGAQWRAGNVHGAEQEVMLVLGEHPDHGDGLALLALCENKRGLKTQALETAKRAVESDAENDFAWRIMGAFYEEDQQRFSDSEAAYRRATELNPGDAWNHLAFANFYSRRAKHKQAQDVFETALSLDPENIETLTDYAEFLLDKGQIDQARELATRAAKISPDDASLILLLGGT